MGHGDGRTGRTRSSARRPPGTRLPSRSSSSATGASARFTPTGCWAHSRTRGRAPRRSSRAWKARATYRRQSAFPRLAAPSRPTPAQDPGARRPRRLVPYDAGPAAKVAPPLPLANLSWLQPYPDLLLDESPNPEDAVVAKETIVSRFSPRSSICRRRTPSDPPRRARLVRERDRRDLRDRRHHHEQRAAAGAGVEMKERLQAARLEWSRAADAHPERSLLRSYVEAWERHDASSSSRSSRGRAHGDAAAPDLVEGRDAVAAFLAGIAFAPGSAAHLLADARPTRQPRRSASTGATAPTPDRSPSTWSGSFPAWSRTWTSSSARALPPARPPQAPDDRGWVRRRGALWPMPTPRASQARLPAESHPTGRRLDPTASSTPSWSSSREAQAGVGEDVPALRARLDDPHEGQAPRSPTSAAWAQAHSSSWPCRERDRARPISFGAAPDRPATVGQTTSEADDGSCRQSSSGDRGQSRYRTGVGRGSPRGEREARVWIAPTLSHSDGRIDTPGWT